MIQTELVNRYDHLESTKSKYVQLAWRSLLFFQIESKYRQLEIILFFQVALGFLGCLQKQSNPQCLENLRVWLLVVSESTLAFLQLA